MAKTNFEKLRLLVHECKYVNDPLLHHTKNVLAGDMAEKFIAVVDVAELFLMKPMEPLRRIALSVALNEVTK